MTYRLKQPIKLLQISVHSVNTIVSLVHTLAILLGGTNRGINLSTVLLECERKEIEIVKAYFKIHTNTPLDDTEKLKDLLKFLRERVNCELHDRIINAHCDDDFDFMGSKSIDILSIFEEIETNKPEPLTHG